ncbi:MAG: 50S ribosomal protein L18 [Acidiferrobacterales bacterium]
MDKFVRRRRRAQKIRQTATRLQMGRLCVHRTPRHIYAQVIDASGRKVLASASTLEPDVRKSIGNGGNIAAASLIGKRIAEKARDAGVTQVAFDRSGFKYHGRVKALAEAAREHGLTF